MHDHTKYALRCGLNEQDSPVSACAVEAKPKPCFTGRDPVCRRTPSSSSSAIWKSASRRKMARALGTSVRSTVAAPAACRSSLPARYQHPVRAHPRESGERWHVLGAAQQRRRARRLPLLSARAHSALGRMALTVWSSSQPGVPARQHELPMQQAYPAPSSTPEEACTVLALR